MKPGVSNGADDRTMGSMAYRVGHLIARYLDKPDPGYEPYTPNDPQALRTTLKPVDVLLIERNNHVSGVIKYLTQSIWSHVALYVGPIGDRVIAGGEPLVLVEANISQGVVAAPLSKYIRNQTRFCRRTGLSENDYARMCTHAAEPLGFDYKIIAWTDLPVAEDGDKLISLAMAESTRLETETA